MNTSQDSCDGQRLRCILDSEFDVAIDGELSSHIEECEHCQRRIQEMAADEEDWVAAAQALGQEFDDCDVTPPVWTKAMAKTLLETPNHPEMLGRIGRYDVEALIGAGGMGVVFKAHDTELNRPIAIKVLSPHLSASGTARKRFAREACAAAGVTADHVIPIYNVKSDVEHPYLVMQYIAGGSLQDRLDAEGALDTREVLRIGIQIARGLAAAHAQGVIHRDVKPSNILLDETVSRALLSDFGLARTADETALTCSGMITGTPQYMSPEQVRGASVGAQSDLYSLGAVLHCCCTGNPPFRAESSLRVLHLVANERPPRIQDFHPQIPDWLCAIIEKLMGKNPESRFSNASEVASLLEACLAHIRHPSTVSIPDQLQLMLDDETKTKPRRKRLLAWSLACVFVLITAILVFFDSRQGTIEIGSEIDGVSLRSIEKDGTSVVRKRLDDGKLNLNVPLGDYRVLLGSDDEKITFGPEKFERSVGEGIRRKILRKPETRINRSPSRRSSAPCQ